MKKVNEEKEKRIESGKKQNEQKKLEEKKGKRLQNGRKKQKHRGEQ